jgi:CRISPR-associated exonuclease Cas4
MKRMSRAVDVQLCAQGTCLEEMTGEKVMRGAVFHHSSRRRRELGFDESLRQRVQEAVAGVRYMLKQTLLPEPVNDSRCPLCSLRDSCLPAVVAETGRLLHLRRELSRADVA